MHCKINNLRKNCGNLEILRAASNLTPDQIVSDISNREYLCVKILGNIKGDQFKVNMGEKKSITNIDIEMYLTLLGNI